MDKVAVVGMSCVFPGADTKDQFFELLKAGRSGIRSVPNSREMMRNLYQKFNDSENNPEYLAGFVEGFDYFDSTFFGLLPRECRYIDPQQRLILQTTWHGFEDACINPKLLVNSDTGVFVGVMGNEWADIQFNTLESLDKYAGTGNGFSLIANRISYHYQFHGPSIAIDTACSSSLVAIKLAAESIQRNECRYAVAAGVNFLLTPGMSLYYQKVGLMAQDAKCKSFSADANGLVRGEGAAVVILQSYQDAIRENRKIYAVLEAAHINHNGFSNGIMAPNRNAQVALLEKIYNRNLDIKKLFYLEAHGTGTLIGDPIEVFSISKVIGSKFEEPCPIGSVKSNIGHLEGAAGIAGFIKTCLSLYYSTLFPSLYANQTNPYIDFTSNDLKLQTELAIINSSEKLYAGVSSFGLGGTNAHILLSAIKNEPEVIPDQTVRYHILKISAQKMQIIKEIAKTYLIRFKSMNDEDAYKFCSVVNKKADLKVRIVLAGDKNKIVENLYKIINDEPISQLIDNQNVLQMIEKYTNGENIDWFEYYPKTYKLLDDMPLYPFEKQLYDIRHILENSFLKYY